MFRRNIFDFLQFFRNINFRQALFEKRQSLTKQKKQTDRRFAPL